MPRTIYGGLTAGMEMARNRAASDRQLAIQDRAQALAELAQTDRTAMAEQRIQQQYAGLESREQIAGLQAQLREKQIEDKAKEATAKMLETQQYHEALKNKWAEDTGIRKKGLGLRREQFESGKTQKQQELAEKVRQYNLTRELDRAKMAMKERDSASLNDYRNNMLKLAQDRNHTDEQNVYFEALADAAEIERKDRVTNGMSVAGELMSQYEFPEMDTATRQMFYSALGDGVDPHEVASAFGLSPKSTGIGRAKKTVPLLPIAPAKRQDQARRMLKGQVGGLVAPAARPPVQVTGERRGVTPAYPPQEQATEPQAVLAPEPNGIQTFVDANKNQIPDDQEEKFQKAVALVSKYEQKMKASPNDPAIASLRGTYLKAKEQVSFFTKQYRNQLESQAGSK